MNPRALPGPEIATATAAEIWAAIGISRQAMEKRAKTGAWKYFQRPRPGIGGFEKIYPVASLPASVRDALAAKAMAADIPAALPCPAPAKTRALKLADEPAHFEVTAQLQQTGTARTIVLSRVQQLVRQNLCSTRRACLVLLSAARAGELPPPVLALLTQARDQRGRPAAAEAADGLPSARTLQRWIGQKEEGRGLTPRPSAVPDLRVSGWYRPFFALTDRPQKPTLKWAHEQLVANWLPAWADTPGAPPPTYTQAVRAYAKRSALDKLKGGHTGSALRAKTFFHKRTYEGMAPFTEVHSDGWTTHFTAPHPVTGEFVTYELWHFHDVATRYVTPMAVGLSENTDVILQGLQACIRVGGVMAIWQTDHTSSVKNKAVLDEHSGLADRLGISVVHPVEVGNSQANGVAENFNTWLDREARELATYQHPQRMDSGTFVKVRRITNAMVRAADKPAEREALRQKAIRMGKGIVFDSYARALDWIASKGKKWNEHPCRELPKLRDPETGRLVHMSPQQSLDAAIAAGWQPVALPEAVLVDQFRPHYRKKVFRGCVTPFGGMRYHDAALGHIEGEEVLVAVDRNDPAHVWVKDLQGRLIVQAKFMAAVGPRTESMTEHSQRKRAEAQIRLREDQIDAIEQRIAPPALELAVAPVFELPTVLPQRRAVADEERPRSFLDSEMRRMAEFGPATPRRQDDEDAPLSRDEQTRLLLEMARKQQELDDRAALDDDADELRVAAG